MYARYYVDFENVQADGLNGLGALDATDVVTVLYTSNSDRMPLRVLDMASGCKAAVRTEKVACGTPNALDFQLATMLGHDIASFGASTKRFVIVSNDTGYCCLASFWQARGGCRVERASSLEGVSAGPSNQAKPTKSPKPSKAAKQVECGLAATLVANGLTKPQAQTALKLISQNSDRNKLNQALCKQLGGKIASEVFKAMKTVS